MPDKVKEILHKVLEWWNKFTAKQKTIIIGITAAVVFTLLFSSGSLQDPNIRSGRDVKQLQKQRRFWRFWMQMTLIIRQARMDSILK